MHNNVFHITSSTVFDDSEASWVSGRRVSGTNNWVHSGAASPTEWTGTLTGTNPGFIDLANRILHPAAGSILIDAGTASMPSPAGAIDIGAFERQ